MIFLFYSFYVTLESPKLKSGVCNIRVGVINHGKHYTGTGACSDSVGNAGSGITAAMCCDCVPQTHSLHSTDTHVTSDLLNAPNLSGPEAWPRGQR